MTERPTPAYSSETQDDALHREVNGIKELLYVRLDEMDKAIELLQAGVDKSPNTTELYGAISQLKEVTDEKFAGVRQKFDDLIARIEQTSRDAKVAVDAAFSAQKEAVGEQNKSNALAIAKSEAAFTKQLDQQQMSAQQTLKSTDDKIDDLKTRIAELGTRITEISGVKKGGDNLWVVLLSAVTALIALGALLVVAFKP